MKKINMNNINESRCGRCGLPHNFPGLKLETNGLCNICDKTPSIDVLKQQKKSQQSEIEKVLHLNYNKKNTYDCILAFSGGKDSSYTLKILIQRYNLNVLAVTIDNGFISEAALNNCRVVTDSLGVDHINFKPAKTFIRQLYKKSLESDSMHPPSAIVRASSLCNSCINTINTHVMNTAIHYSCPIVAGGYVGGQLPKNIGVMEIDLETNRELSRVRAERYRDYFGGNAKNYLESIKSSDLSKVWVINPMIGENLTDVEIIREIIDLGWSKPNNTGKSSTNCLINDLGIYAHMERHGFNPYSLEIADQVRHGLIKFEDAVKKYQEGINFKNVAWIADELGINRDEL